MRAYRYGGLAVALLLGVIGALLPSALHPGPAFADGGSLSSFISRPGDQVVTVPNGTYSGGTVNAPHPATTGSYKGWLVLVAQSPRGVVVDLSKGPLTLDAGTSRVLFVGFTFANGLVSVRGDDIAFWYTEHTFPVEEWNRQFQAAGGNAAGLKDMANGLPKTIWIGEYTNRTVQRTQILGADIHDVGDDGVFVGPSQGAVIRGTRIWNIDEKTYDPGYNPWSTKGDLFHNDAVQIPGSVSDFTMADTSIGATMNIGGDNGTSTNLQFNKLWIAGSPGIGFNLFVQGSNRITGAMRDIRGFGNGTSFPDDPAWDQIREDFNETKSAIWPASLNDQRLGIASLGTNLNKAPPPGVTLSGRRMVDPRQALDHAQNPANVWRVANPYNSWPSLFGLPAWTGEGSVATTTTSRPAPTTTTTARPRRTSVTTARVTTTTKAPAATSTTSTASTEQAKKSKTQPTAPATPSASRPLAPRTTPTGTSVQRPQVVEGEEWLPITKVEEVLPVIRVAAEERSSGIPYLAALIALLAVASPWHVARRRRGRRRVRR